MRQIKMEIFWGGNKIGLAHEMNNHDIKASLGFASSKTSN
jgi:hypothetical protein